jgi:1,4-alpha-glucan branching enzyme
MVKGYFSFVLHTHLPWVLGHGRWPHGTDWLNEATAECYIPLLNELNALVNEGYHPHINIGITPILQEQLGSPGFVEEFTYYLKNKIASAHQDISEFEKKGQKEYAKIARMWQDFFKQIDRDFTHTSNMDLLGAFSVMQSAGHIELLTSAATHGYLPLLKNDRSVNAQINLGTQVYKRNFNCAASGIWLPECAYRPAYKWKPPVGKKQTSYMRKGVDEVVSMHNLRYFITDSHLLKGGRAIGVYLARFKALKNLWQHFDKEFTAVKEDFTKDAHEIYLIASNPAIMPVAVFTRDPETALQVWSGDLGYPGEARYLDFHKKRFPGGLRYWCVTHPKIDLAAKELYDPSVVLEMIQHHARHFVSLVKKISNDYYRTHRAPAFTCTPFDTELFGHWWFEGPQWLAHVLRYIEDDKELKLATGNQIIETLQPNKVISLPEGSWGEGGFHYIWLNRATEWTWKRIYEAEDEFYKLYDAIMASNNNTLKRVLKQCARELLLLQSSDWQFLISTWSARDYAELRFSRHYDHFKALVRMLKQDSLSTADMNYLKDCEQQDSCFPDLDLAIFKNA